MPGHALASVARTAPLSPGDLPRLVDAVEAGAAVVSRLNGPGAPAPDALDRAARFLYRRWVLEVLLLAYAQGPIGFNRFRNELRDVSGQVLSQKLAVLTRRGLLERGPDPTRPGRTAYHPTPTAQTLGAAVYTLTQGKAFHARASHHDAEAVRFVDEASLPVVAGSGPLGPALDRYARAARGFAATHASAKPVPGFEAALATCRRFTRACVHKWHGAVLHALLAGGAQRFGELSRATGAGPEALSRALERLEALGNVTRDVHASGPRARYRVTPWGRFDLCLGLPPILLVPPSEAHAPRADALHAD